MTTPTTTGLWTTPVLASWLRAIGVPHRPDVKFDYGPKWAKGTVVVAQVVAIRGPAGRGIAPIEAEPYASQPGFELRFRGKPLFDGQIEELSRVAHKRILATFTTLPVTVSGVRLLRGDKITAQPQRDLVVVNPGERDMWTCSYYVNVIEQP